MIDLSRLHGIYLIKVIAGLIAIGANLLCWIPVSKRRKACTEKKSTEMKKQSILILRLTQIGLPAALIALVCGLTLIAK